MNYSGDKTTEMQIKNKTKNHYKNLLDHLSMTSSRKKDCSNL